jgi:hypothetical protein
MFSGKIIMIAGTGISKRQAAALPLSLLLVALQWPHIVSQFFVPTYSMNGFMLQNHVVETISDVPSFFDCYTKCELGQMCFSFNYYSGQLMCEFNNATHVSHPDDVVPSSNASYLHIENKIPPYCMFSKYTFSNSLIIHEVIGH